MNTVIAAFGGMRECQTKPLWQFDYGQIIRFAGIPLPETYEVHFSNEHNGTATTSIGNADGASIPDQYLTSGKDVYAWVFLHTGESDGETCYEARIPVKKRAQPSDAPPTPVQQSAIDQAIAALNSGVTRSEAAATSASGSAASATGSAAAASVSADSAAASASAAASSATSAGESAASASRSANTAGADAASAASSASSAGASATDASASARSAAGSAGDAAAAKTAAETAQGLAENAQEAAESETLKAEGYAIGKQNGADVGSGSTYYQNNAKYYKEQAALSATAAGDAQTAAETAQSKAEDAQEAAENAQEAAEAAEAAVEAKLEEEVSNAVDAWLDNHPEATTTVQDGAITKAKLNSSLADKVDEIDGKAPAIMDNSAKENSHTGLTGVRKITFYGNTSAFSSHARYINSKNYIPQLSKTWTADNGNLSLVAAGHFVTYNGTPTAKGTTFVYDTTLGTPLPAGTYKFRVELPSALSSDAQFIVSVFYESTSTTRTQVLAKNVRSTLINEFEFTTTEKAVKLGVKVGYAKDEVYSNYTLWLGIYDSTATVVDTGLTVASSGTLEYTNAALFNLPTIDTMQHESVIAYTADTKTYVDAHTPDIIGYWNDHVYALPEDFGAVGDGTTDDKQALLDCIAYSASSGKPVRGFAKYKTTSTLLINTRYQDIYLRYLVYTGNDAAIQLSERNITLGFDVIESSGIGILFQRYSTQSCQMHVVIGNRIKATGDCVKATGNTYYNTVTVRSMESTAGNCIEFDNSVITGNISEYTFRDCSFACPAGWAGKNLFGAKLYGCTVEGNCLNGYLNPINCTFIGCRHREFTDAVQRRVINGDATATNGPLIKYTINPTYHGTHGLKYITADGIPWCSIDVSEVQGYDTLPQSSGSEDDPNWLWLAYNGIDVGSAIRGIGTGSYTVYGNNVYFIGMNKVFVPGARTIYTFDKATYDMTLFESQTDANILAAFNQGGWGTDFICGYSHTNYYMNASFGAVGYNDLTLTQQNGNTAKIYDKLGNVLFDGTNAGDGVWSLKCKVDRSKHNRCSNYHENGWWCYDGTNETWEITKLS